jgi:hypothetical protein
MLSANVLVNIYANNSKYPVVRYNMPTNLTQVHKIILSKEFNSTPLGVTWLVFCMNGAVGPTAVIPVNHFWSMGTSSSNNFWERSASNEQSVPSSTLCTNLFPS